jgi:hypothetical protein
MIRSDLVARPATDRVTTVIADGVDPVDHVVISGQQMPEDRFDAGFGLAGQLHLDGGPPLLPVPVGGE